MVKIKRSNIESKNKKNFYKIQMKTIISFAHNFSDFFPIPLG